MNSTHSNPMISATSILSLFAVFVLLAVAYFLSLRVLPKTSSGKIRVLFVWHLFDALIHFFFEGSYLYHCFFTYTQLPPHHSANMAGQYNGGAYLGHQDRLYGAIHGDSATAKLWQEYARADRRWGGADLTVISLEILTVFGAGPLALWVCNILRRNDPRVWFWATVLATGELYGGKSIIPVHLACGIQHMHRSMLTLSFQDS